MTSRLFDKIINSRLSIWFPLLFVIPLFVLAYSSISSLKSAAFEKANEALYVAASRSAMNVDLFLNNILVAIGSEAQTQTFVDLLKNNSRRDSEQALAILNSLLSKNELYISSYALLDFSGKNILDTKFSNIGKNESDEKYFYVSGRVGTVFIDDVRFYDDGSADLTFSAPVRDSSGKILGVLRVKYSAAVLQMLVAANYGLVGKKSFPILVDENGLRLAHGEKPTDIYQLVTRLDALSLNRLRFEKRVPIGVQFDTKLKLNMEKTAGENTTVINDQELYSGFYAKIESKPWFVFYFQPENSFKAMINTQTNTALFLSIFMLGIVLILGLLGRKLFYELQNRERQLSTAQEKLRQILEKEQKSAKEIKQDLYLGRKVQNAILVVPELPSSVEIVCSQEAMSFVSGDIYFINWNKKHQVVSFLMNDVTGHGIQAALKASACHQIAKNIWTSDMYEERPEGVRLETYDYQVQEFLSGLDYEKPDYNAMIGAEFYLETGRILMYRSNYVRPILLSPEIDLFSDAKKQPNGTRWKSLLLPFENKKIFEHKLRPGSVVILLSDGYLGSCRVEADFYHYIENALYGAFDPSPQFIKSMIVNWFKDAEKCIEDDRTLLVFRWLPKKNFGCLDVA